MTGIRVWKTRLEARSHVNATPNVEKQVRGARMSCAREEPK